MEGIHTGFLRHIMGKQARRRRYVTWETPGAEGVREATWTQLARIYIGRRQASMAKWVALRPLFEMCARETWYEGVGCRREACRHKMHQRNKFGPPWKYWGRLRGRGALGRMSRSRNRRREGGRVGKSACWDGDERRPGGKMILCGRRRWWFVDEGRPGLSVGPVSMAP